MGRRGAAALEFALASPLMIVLLGGSADFGLAQYSRASLANAVAAGAEYAYLTGANVALSNIQNVVTKVSGLTSANLSFTGSAAPTPYCVKGSPPVMTLATAWNDPCNPSQPGDSATAGLYVVISATYTSTGIMGGFMASSTYKITETATVMLK